MSLAGPASRAACITFGRPKCQIQLRRGQNPDHRDSGVRGPPLHARIELAYPVRARPRRHAKATALSCAKRGLGLGEAGDDQAGLGGHRQGVEGRLFEQLSVRATRSVGSLTSRLKLRASAFRLIASLSAVLGRRDPDAAAGKLALEVGHRFAIRSDDEADQSPTGRTSRVTTHNRSRSRDCGPPSSSVVGSHCARCAIMRSVSPSALRLGGRLRSAAGGGARSASVIQPALRRACMIIASASSREISKPSRIPGSRSALAVLALGPAGQIVGGAAGQVLDRLDAVLAEPDQHRGGHAGDLFELVLDAEFLALGVEFGLDLGEIFARAGLQLACGLLVETLDAGDFLGVHHGEFLHRVKAFRGQQLPDHFVDVERVDKHPRAVLELGLAALRLLLLGQNVDVPAGQLGSEPDVLAAAADRERQLLVRDHDLDALALFVEHHLGDFGRRKRVDPLLPPTKLYFDSPVHFAAGAGSPAGSRGAKSKAAVVMKGVSVVLVGCNLRQVGGRCRQVLMPGNRKQNARAGSLLRGGRWGMAIASAPIAGPDATPERFALL